MSSQKSNSLQLGSNIWERLPIELISEFCRNADPASAIITLFADKSLHNQDSLWRNIVTQLKLDIGSNHRDACIKWLKIHRHVLQIYGDSDSVTINDWSSYFHKRYHYLSVEQALQKQYPAFKIPLDYLEWLILRPTSKTEYGAHHRGWDWFPWVEKPSLVRDANSLWINVAMLNDKHDMFINCDTKHKLFGSTVDCYDTELEDQDFDQVWSNWLAVITRDSYTQLWDGTSYRRNLFGEKVFSFF